MLKEWGSNNEINCNKTMCPEKINDKQNIIK